MLKKNADATSASANAQTERARKAGEADQPKHAVLPTAAINEPKVDWVPLAWAPLRYNSYGYIRSVEQWGENLDAKVKQFVASISSRNDARILEYSFRSTKKWEAWINAGEFVHFSARILDRSTCRLAAIIWPAAIRTNY